MNFFRNIIPGWQSVLLAALSAILLVLSFPDFEFWYLAWFALVPLMMAVEREKASALRAFVVGWLFGTIFFFGTCWWLTYAPINYAGFPPWLAYSGMTFIAAGVGLFPALFSVVMATLLRRLGSQAFLAAPFVWVSAEFLRYWLTGNNWNAIGYSQAPNRSAVHLASLGGVATVGVVLIACTSLMCLWLGNRRRHLFLVFAILPFAAFITADLFPPRSDLLGDETRLGKNYVIGVQPNVPMSFLDSSRLEQLRDRQISSAEDAIGRGGYESNAGEKHSVTVVLPESPMNFMYEDDSEFRGFINAFARRNNLNVLFNSAEPDTTNGKYFNSAVMVGPDGRKVDEYDKIYLLPFGEAVPPLLDGLLPGFVGNFSYGREYDLFPVGDAKAGVMICFESHFGQLSREYVRNGADVIIEMTNDGYLGPTPVLRQHLANAVFRAVETNRPLLRVTNVGITAYISPSGDVVGPAGSYQEATRVWSVSKSDGSQTLYVRYGDWFAWLCSAITIILFAFATLRRRGTARSK